MHSKHLRSLLAFLIALLLLFPALPAAAAELPAPTDLTGIQNYPEAPETEAPATILMEAKTEGKHFTGLEIQPESADMASRSVQLNDLQERVHIVNGDIKEAVQIFGAASCHVVTSNPPYMTAQHGLQNPDQPKAIARHEVLCTLEDVISQAAGLLMPGGRFYMVHRPFRLAEIMTGLCAHGLEPKRMQLVYPYVDREPNMVLLEAVKGGRPRITVEKPLIIYKEPGKYMDEIYDIYGY